MQAVKERFRLGIVPNAVTFATLLLLCVVMLLGEAGTIPKQGSSHLIYRIVGSLLLVALPAIAGLFVAYGAFLISSRSQSVADITYCITFFLGLVAICGSAICFAIAVQSDLNAQQEFATAIKSSVKEYANELKTGDQSSLTRSVDIRLEAIRRVEPQLSGTARNIALITRDALLRYRVHTVEYDEALRPVLNPMWSDWTTVTSRADLHERLSRIERFRSAIDQLESADRNFPKWFDESNAGKLSAKLRKQLRAKIEDGAAQRVKLQMRASDRRMTEAAAGLVKLLAREWPNWQFDELSELLIFSDALSATDAEAKYHELNLILHEEVALQTTLQEQAISNMEVMASVP